ncbi:MAG: hypothetical protein GY861_17275 [bacterium]|nr:hypothetical protein [bacterium]
MTLADIELETFEKIVNNATRPELDKLQAIVEKEIRLSESCIKDGQEKRK